MSTYYGVETERVFDLKHWKYIKRYKKNGRWVYEYNTNATRTDRFENTLNRLRQQGQYTAYDGQLTNRAQRTVDARWNYIVNEPKKFAKDVRTKDVYSTIAKALDALSSQKQKTGWKASRVAEKGKRFVANLFGKTTKQQRQQRSSSAQAMSNRSGQQISQNSVRRNQQIRSLQDRSSAKPMYVDRKIQIPYWSPAYHKRNK